MYQQNLQDPGCLTGEGSIWRGIYTSISGLSYRRGQYLKGEGIFMSSGPFSYWLISLTWGRHSGKQVVGRQGANEVGRRIWDPKTSTLICPRFTAILTKSFFSVLWHIGKLNTLLIGFIHNWNMATLCIAICFICCTIVRLNRFAVIWTSAQHLRFLRFSVVASASWSRTCYLLASCITGTTASPNKWMIISTSYSEYLFCGISHSEILLPLGLNYLLQLVGLSILHSWPTMKKGRAEWKSYS